MDIKGYKIQGQIGQGGMAIVYRAIQESLDRPVALKVMNPLFAENPQFTSRFLDEGRLLASLRHHNIMTIYDIGVCDNLHYISMEYVDGGDLKQRIREGITPLTALDYVITIGSCLQVAHVAKIVHRDVKPVNILFRNDDTLLLTDFGIAKQLVGRKNITVTGSLVGSPYYLSPEQALGGDVDGRADIYSLGIVLFEMLMGKRPFDGDSQIDVALKHIEGNLPLLPPHLSHFQSLVDKMTAKQTHDRFRDAASMVQAAQLLRHSYQWDNDSKVVAEPQFFPGFDDTTVLYIGDEEDVIDAHIARLGQSATADTTALRQEQRQARHELKKHPQPGDQPDGQGDEHPTTKNWGSVRMGGIAAGLWVLALFTTLLTVGLPDYTSSVPTPEATQEKPTHPKTYMKTEQSFDQPIAQPLVEYPKPSELIQQTDTQPQQSVNMEIQHKTGEQIESEPNSQNEIDILLKKAEIAISEYRLTSPVGNNAFDYYQQVLQTDPENSQANNGFSDIADRYLQLARSALKKDQLEKAKQYVERGLNVKKDHPGLLSFRADLVNQEIQADATTRQQAQEYSRIYPYEPPQPATTPERPKASFFQRLKKMMQTPGNKVDQKFEKDFVSDAED